MKTGWLANPFTKTARDLRGAVIGWTVALAVLVGSNVAAFHAVLGVGAPDRAQQIAEISRLMGAFGYLLGEIVPLDNVGGYLTVRLLTVLPLFLGIWAALAGTGLLRGEEETGILDMHQAAPLSRRRLLGSKIAGFTAAATGIGVAFWVLLLASGAALNEPIGPGPAALAALNTMTFVWAWGMLALLLGQVMRGRRAAAGIAAAVLVASYVVDTNLGQAGVYKAWTSLLPYHFYSINKPLVPGRAFAWSSYSVMVVLGLLCAAGALAMYQRRDVGGVFRPFRAGATHAPRRGGTLAGLGSPFTRALRDLLGPAVAWTIGIAVYSFIIEGSAKDMLAPIQAIARGPLAAFLGGVNTTMGLLQLTILSTMTLIFAGFGLTQVAAWTGEEESGRLEAVLSAPRRRSAVLLARFAAVVLAATALAVAMGGALVLGGALFGLTLDAGKLWPGVLTLVPLALVVVAAGWALAAALPRPGVAVPVVGALIVGMFFFETLAPLLHLPDAFLGLSIFHHYGRPFLEGVPVGGLLTLLTATGLLLAIAVWCFGRRDIAK